MLIFGTLSRLKRTETHERCKPPRYPRNKRPVSALHDFPRYQRGRKVGSFAGSLDESNPLRESVLKIPWKCVSRLTDGRAVQDLGVERRERFCIGGPKPSTNSFLVTVDNYESAFL
jgi:hypothetical protein